MSRAKYTADLSPIRYIYPYINEDEEIDWHFVGTFSACKNRLIQHLELDLEKTKQLTEKDIRNEI